MSGVKQHVDHASGQPTAGFRLMYYLLVVAIAGILIGVLYVGGLSQ